MPEMTTHRRRFLVSAPQATPTPHAQRSRAAPSWLPAVLQGARAGAGWLTAIVSVFTGVGLTYLLRNTDALAIGPRVAGALPLQQLAGGAGQPLLRVAVAWLCAGAIAGFALASLTRSRPFIRTAVSTLLAAALLLAAGAVADAVAQSDPIAPHLAPQLSRAGTWVAAAFYCMAGLLVGLACPTRGSASRGLAAR